MKKDIHKIDNVLIRTGSVLMVFVFLGGGCSVMLGSVADKSATELLALGAGFTAAVAMLAVGGLIRRKENEVIAVWEILERTTEVAASDLQDSTGFSRPFIEEALTLINRQGQAYYVWDRQRDVIVDGRLRTSTLVIADCPSCGAGINRTVPIDLSEIPTCEYCHKAIPMAHLNELRSDLIRQIRAEAEPESGFSVLLFILLLLFFWPAAVVYAVWKSQLFRGWRRAWSGRAPTRPVMGDRA